MEHFEGWQSLLNPEFYIKMGGFWLILFVIFAETGLFIGFFLPGDSFLFVAGIYAKDIIRETFGSFGGDFVDTSVLAFCIAIAAIIGNEVGYFFGLKMGPALYKKEDSLLFKKKYLFQTHDFFDKHGSLAVIMARFVPIVRTFTPIVAGIVKMEKKVFLKDNIVGALLWSFSLVYAGHYLNELFLNEFGIDLKSKLEYIVITIVLITTLPIIIKFFFSGKKENTEKED